MPDETQPKPAPTATKPAGEGGGASPVIGTCHFRDGTTAAMTRQECDDGGGKWEPPPPA